MEWVDYWTVNGLKIKGEFKVTKKVFFYIIDRNDESGIQINGSSDNFLTVLLAERVGQLLNEISKLHHPGNPIA